VCTLKLFPEETIHCIEWSLEKLNKMYNSKPSSLNRVLQALKSNTAENLDPKTINEAHSFLKNGPKSFQDCLAYARNKFEKFYHHNILLLMEAYPLDHKTDDGKLFWSLPRRPPQILKFDINIPEHLEFIKSTSRLRADVFNIHIPMDIKSNAFKDYII